MNIEIRRVRLAAVVGLAAYAFLAVLSIQVGASNPVPRPKESPPSDRYTGVVLPILHKYCLGCHSSQIKKGGLDLERFATADDIRKDIKPWLGVIEQLHAGQMPPKEMPQPTTEEKRRLTSWVRGFLDNEARSRADDPGYVPLRRLSNTEYDNTIRDLTGIDLRPAREFPADGAAGEGFTNAAEALTDISPILLSKYLNAAKEISEHAVLLPDGMRFSASKTRRDWTDESTARLQRFYSRFVADEGRLAIQPYLAATVRYGDALRAGKVTIAKIADTEKLNAKYLGILYRTLMSKTPSPPLEQLRAHWRQAGEKDVPALAAELTAWQNALWKVVRVSNYLQPAGNGFAESLSRQVAHDPSVAESVPVRVAIKPTPGQNDVVLYLTARDSFPVEPGTHVVWRQPRFEAAGKPPLLLRDYSQFGPTFEVDYPSVFANSAKYLMATVEAANNYTMSVEALARKRGLDPTFLKRWIEILAVKPINGETNPESIGQVVPTIPLTLLDEKLAQNNNLPAINGWHKAGMDLPALLTNSSNTEEHIPGKASPHSVVVHPSPQQFVAVVWKSPITGPVRVTARITHVHPNCGNGVAWWLEHRRGERATLLAEDAIALGGEARPPAKTFLVEKDDNILLAVDAHDGDHSCDLTDIALTVTETDKPGHVWDMAADIADNVLDSNPHPDRLGNKDTWSFVLGPTRAVGKAVQAIIPPNSVLGRWRDAASDPTRNADAARLAQEAQTLLSGSRPAGEKDPDRLLYDNLVAVDSVLFQGVAPARLGKPRPTTMAYGLGQERFGRQSNDKPVAADSLVADANSVVEVRLPASLFRQRQFVVEGELDGPAGNRVVQFQALTAPPGPYLRWDGVTPIVASPTGAGYRQLQQGYEEFRRVFPLFLCFPKVIPTDEIVSLKMFHREDEPLMRLFLDAPQAKYLDRLWAEHQLISRQAVAENAYLPQFIGFVTQDGTKEALAFFESLRPVFKKRAEAFLKEEEDAIPKQLDALHKFAARAYRRPCTEKEKAALRNMYQAVRRKGASHEEAFRGILARVLVSPAFLFRIEQAPPRKTPGFINDWELATRLSYFLWAAPPDAELWKLAAAKRLHDPKVLEAQVERMLQEDRLRAMAIEFGTQWVHVRGFDELQEKNEKLFPMFDVTLRKAIYEEAILFFQDLFRSDRSVTQILDADYTFLNETLAKHYGIPGVTGPEWRQVNGVRKYGRGGILGLASIQTKQAGASRTSPVLRGNWVVETLLGEKLPRPPANVPRLPEEEGGADKLTMRQLVEKHTKVPSCAVCHRRIDPFGFALEKYDPIGRLRAKDFGGLPVDARARLRDGTEFEGIDGLRTYLLTKKRDVIIQIFCRRLLGYALGRSVTLSDTTLLNRMISALKTHQGRLSAAVHTIVLSPQFRMIRGSDFSESGHTSQETRNHDTHNPPLLPSYLPARRRRDDGPAVAGVASRVGRRKAEERRFGAAGAIRLSVCWKRVP